MEKEAWKTFGFDNIKDILNRQLSSRIFPHAYLFVGAEGVGKKTLSLELAAKILDTERPLTHPDFKLLEYAENVEQVREFMASLNFRPFAGAFKVAVIDNVQNINSYGVNALLKTLEEPTSSTILILISSTRNLLPTLLSRCQIFSFNRFSLRQLDEFARTEELAIAPEWLALSFGQIGRLKKLAADGSWANKQQQEAVELQQLRENALGQRLAKLPQYADLEEGELKEKLTHWLATATQDLTAGGVQMLKSVQALYQALLDLNTNKNTKLVLQGLFFNL